MNTVLAWLKSVKWVAYVILAVGVGILLLVLRNLFAGSKPTGTNSRLPDVPPALQAKVDQVEEEALQAKATAKATTDAQVQQIKTISQIPDGAERRKQLAQMLQNM